MALQMYSAKLQRLLVGRKRGTMFREIYGWFPHAFNITDLRMSGCCSMN
jgi:hypothetical protein